MVCEEKFFATTDFVILYGISKTSNKIFLVKKFFENFLNIFFRYRRVILGCFKEKKIFSVSRPYLSLRKIVS